MIKITISAMNMEAVCSSEKFERHNPGHHNKNIKLDFKETAREGINWIQVA
jgi:hypothetical protein